MIAKPPRMFADAPPLAQMRTWLPLAALVSMRLLNARSTETKWAWLVAVLPMPDGLLR
jgi:hypothetical protein